MTITISASFLLTWSIFPCLQCISFLEYYKVRRHHGNCFTSSHKSPASCGRFPTALIGWWPISLFFWELGMRHCGVGDSGCFGIGDSYNAYGKVRDYWVLASSLLITAYLCSLTQSSYPQVKVFASFSPSFIPVFLPSSLPSFVPLPSFLSSFFSLLSSKGPNWWVSRSWMQAAIFPSDCLSSALLLLSSSL